MHPNYRQMFVFDARERLYTNKKRTPFLLSTVFAGWPRASGGRRTTVKNNILDKCPCPPNTQVLAEISGANLQIQFRGNCPFWENAFLKQSPILKRRRPGSGSRTRSTRFKKCLMQRRTNLDPCPIKSKSQSLGQKSEPGIKRKGPLMGGSPEFCHFRWTTVLPISSVRCLGHESVLVSLSHCAQDCSKTHIQIDYVFRTRFRLLDELIEN